MLRKHPPSKVFETLKANNWSRSKTCQDLGISAPTLHKTIAILTSMGYLVEDSAYDKDRRKYLIDQAEAAHGAAPGGFDVKGVSTLYDAAGDVRLQWVKTNSAVPGPDEWAKIVKDAFADTARIECVPPPAATNADLLTVYPIGDHHVAMYAWAEETGGDYDIKIAERLLAQAGSHLVSCAPPSDRALIINVGDFFHVDNTQAVTARSKHNLDVDTRYAAMIRAGVTMLRALIETALTKHQLVEVVCSPGNHDDIGALWLALALGLLYENNPRVRIEQNAGKFHYFRHGSTLLGVTHGDSVKLEQLGGVMSVDRREDWGQTLHRYWITGHIHQKRVLELAGCMVESFRTLASRDAWANAAGYRSGRDMNAIVYSKSHGEVARHRFDASMLA